MSVRTVLVVHREPIAAEAIATALGRYPALVPIGTASSAAAAERHATRADVAVVDDRLPGAMDAARRLRRAGVRVVLIGEAVDRDGDDESLRVMVDASVARLATALVPGVVPRTRGIGSLSRREEEILGLAARGMAGKQIATHLGISPKTVERHKSRIFRKLGVPNQAAAVAYAASTGAIRVNGSYGWNPSST